ncbi:MAG: hypothetical protein DMF61_05210 [Blastocatellia bacterium AA13]|nr:MAG: hypothetical protein DMF61_05210 [Blastocatellia bacterium AA13]
MILHHAYWLILAIPVGAGLWFWKLPMPLLRGLRITAVVMILLAMCGIAVTLPGRAGTVVVIADRSDSMPPGSDAAHKEAINLIRGAIGSDQQLAVVSFGRSSSLEHTSPSSEFAGFTGDVGSDESNLSDALEKALALIPPDAPGRILILSDGRWTGKDPANLAWRAAARGIAIDYRALERSAANDLAVARFEAAGAVAPGEAFMINAWIQSPLQQDISYELTRNGAVISAGKHTCSSGLNRLTFRDIAGEPGACSYTLRVAGPGQDPIPENNTARLLVGVRGPKPVLLLTASADSGLGRLLSAGGLNVKARSRESLQWSLETLSNYSACIVENVAADKIGARGMENLTAWVRDSGAGLMFSGGKNSYGPGGYYKSPLEPIMPLSMELRREHRKLAMAIVVAMDRSGSMAMAAGGGRTKMDLANLAAVQVLDLMSPVDEFGVIAIDSAPHTIVNLGPPDNPGAIRNQILRVDSGGGGIFIYEALAASAEMLIGAKAGTKHIILFADAADSEEPGKYQKLIEKCSGAGITISVVGLGKESDQDADLLRDIARRGGGRVFFTDNPEELPRLFAQDTFVVARSTFVDEPTPIEFAGGLIGLTGKQYRGPPSLGGYNLCYLRPEANLGALTLDDYKAPIIASWQAGLGRVVCYTGEADGAYAGAMARWRDVGDLFTGLVRWTAGESNMLPGNLLVTQELKNGAASITLHLDPERESEPFTELPGLTVLKGIAGSTPRTEKAAFQWMSADTLEATVDLRGNETALATVEVFGAGKLTLPPVCLPYSAEFRPAEADSGLIALSKIARATSGRDRASLGGIWKDLPRRPRFFELTPWLLGLALVSLLLEVLERRTGLVSASGSINLLTRRRTAERRAERRADRGPAQSLRTPLTRATDIRAIAKVKSPASETRKSTVETVISQEQPPELTAALRQASRRAKSRTDRER